MSYFKLRIKAFKDASRGVIFFSKESHSRIHFIFTALAILLAWVLQVSRWEWCILLLCCALVLGVEALNSSIERLTDLTSPGWNKQAGLVKDIAAGAVLIVSLFAALIGLVIFLPHLSSVMS